MNGEKRRADALVSAVFGVSRARAGELIRKGLVTAGGNVVDKPSRMLDAGGDISCEAPKPEYVSRGGLKLAHALSFFGVQAKDRVCLDVGASTGGFTHCLLAHGAVKVYAIDTGTGQLAPLLCGDSRVVSMEKTNVNGLSRADFPEAVTFACVDVSFVSVTRIMAAVFDILDDTGQAVFLIKPQFEAGRGNIGKRGVVTDLRVHRSVLNAVYDSAAVMGYAACGVTRSPIKGGSGNTEFLMHFDKAKEGLPAAAFKEASRRVVL